MDDKLIKINDNLPGLVAQACNPRPGVEETGWLGVRVHPWQHKEFKAGPGSTRLPQTNTAIGLPTVDVFSMCQAQAVP